MTEDLVVTAEVDFENFVLEAEAVEATFIDSLLVFSESLTKDFSVFSAV